LEPLVAAAEELRHRSAASPGSSGDAA